jgi:type IV secretion system protein TrbE
MEKLKTYKKTQPGFADLLTYANLVSSGLVMTKDGSLVAGYYTRPPDTASATPEMQALISSRANDAMLKLGTGWAKWDDVFSVEAADYPARETSHFPDPVSRAVDEERRRRFMAEGEHFDNERAMFLCYTPPIQQVSKLEDLAYSDDGNQSISLFSKIVAKFDQALNQFEDQIGRLIGMRRMRSYKVMDMTGREHLQDELVNALNYIVTGKPDPVMIPAAACYLDCILGCRDFYPGETPYFGGEYISCISIDGFPAEHLPNITAHLNTLALPYRFSQRAIFLDPQDAVKDINTYKRKWGQKMRGLISVVAGNKGATNEYAVKMHSEAEAAASLAQTKQVLYLYYSAVIVLRHADPDRLEDWQREVSRAITDCGFNARIEDTNSVEAWLGSMPGDTIRNVRRPLIHTQNLADFLPLSGIWTGLDHNPCPLYPPNSPPLMHAATVGCIPFRFNIHVGDVPHTLIMGPIGQGKSTLTAMIALQALRYQGIRIWCLDYKRGMYATVKACGGSHYEIGGGGSPSFCPLGVLDDDSDFNWAQDYLETCYQLQTQKAFTPAQRSLVFAALQGLANTPERSLTDFCLMIQDEQIREALKYYTLKGAGGYLLDARKDSITVSHFNVFETLELMSGHDDKIRLPTLLYLFRRFERSLDGSPALLFISEAWVALGNEFWRAKVREWLKLLRSKNCGVIMDTQSLSDAYRSGILDVLIESCPTKIYLPNQEALKRGTDKAPGPIDLYEAMQLNETQIEIIRSARGKREYYVTSPEGARLIDLDLGPMALAIAGATSEDDAKQVRALVKQYGDTDWVWHFLTNRGVDYVDLLAS